MSAYIAPLMLLIGLVAGSVAVWLARGREIARRQDDVERVAAERNAALERSDSLAAELAAERIARAALAAEHAADGRAHQQHLAGLTALRGEIETKLQAMAGEALRGNREEFVALADQVFARHQQSASALLGDKEKAIESLLAPINASLAEYRKGMSELEKAREAAFGGIEVRLLDVARAQGEVSRETRKLVTALQAAPKTRGRWGEQQLHNVMELSGMTHYIDFEVEKTLDRDDTRLRPDVILRLPGNRRIIVDAKTSTAAYLDAVDAADDDAKQAHLDRHARQLRTHMKQLAGKSYWEALPFTPDFVVMFIPGENFFAAAIERDPLLFEDAVAARVLIVTPTTLIALAKAIAFGWHQEEIAENTKKVEELGRELYRRVVAMGGHIVSLGKGLDSAVGHYNAFIGSLEGRVMPAARRFNELKVDGTGEAVPEAKPIEIETRRLRRDSELLAPPATLVPLAAADDAID